MPEDASRNKESSTLLLQASAWAAIERKCSFAEATEAIRQQADLSMKTVDEVAAAVLTRTIHSG